MSDQREATAADGTPVAVVKEDRETKKARFAQIVDRGFVTHRLNAHKLPDDKHGQWVRDDPMEITRLQSLGYEVADPKIYSGVNNPHGDGTKMVVGDVMFMVCSKDDHELHQEIARERFHQTYVKQPREGIKLQKVAKDLEQHGIQFEDESTAAQLISNPKDI